MGVMWNGEPRCGGVIRCELWCDVKCGVVGISVCEMWCNVGVCKVRLKCKMCDVEYGVVWNVVSWYVECCIMQNVESYDVKCGGVKLW